MSGLEPGRRKPPGSETQGSTRLQLTASSLSFTVLSFPLIPAPTGVAETDQHWYLHRVFPMNGNEFFSICRCVMAFCSRETNWVVSKPEERWHFCRGRVAPQTLKDVQNRRDIMASSWDTNHKRPEKTVSQHCKEYLEKKNHLADLGVSSLKFSK